MSVTAKKYFRICIVSEQLAGGGAERCSAVLSQFFEANNCEVHHVITIDKIEYPFAGKLLNLGQLKKGGFNLADRFNRFKVLHHFFKSNSFDFIIDTRVVNRQLQEFYIVKFIYNAPLIVMVHSYMTNLYFPKNHFLANFIYSNAKKIIGVSNVIKNKITSQYRYKQVQTIYNPIAIDYISKQSKIAIDVNFKFILAVGNMNTNVKQFDHLINIYSNSDLPNLDIKLLILGIGLLKESLETQVCKLNLQDKIIFKGTIENPFPYYKLALFTVLTSRNEGFPTVLLESLACKTPVIAYNCLSGPSEIIQNNENGILVENQNQEQMILAMNEMISNKKLYLHCKTNAQKSVEKFSIQTIGNQWLQLFKSLQE
ncbi:glycosyltransferase [Flavobacterium sp.]|uniref:glycosyltransferase n=1 Tax=Flavobacterium sp. TaxID=239 RepID=UPI00375257EF